MHKLLFIFFISSCSLLPSTFDYNQSHMITNIQQDIIHLTCSHDDIIRLDEHIEWLELYSISKDTSDIVPMIEILDKEVSEFHKRELPPSKTYCNIKKKILLQHANMIANTIQGRF